jgi:hypothetical protein
MSAAMAVNEGYWQTGTAPAAASVAGTVVTIGGVVTAVTSCNSPSICGAQQMAVQDLSIWGGNLKGILPSGTGTVTCANSGANTLVTCVIKVMWTEKSLVQNQAAGAGANAGTPADLVLVVQP